MDKTAVITGGARRLGKEIALALARNGYQIGLCYFKSQEDAAATSAQIKRETSQKCVTFIADFRKDEEVSGLLARICAELPTPTLLINNASTFRQHRLGELREVDFDANWSVNFKAPLFLTQSFANLGGEGQIINMLDGNITKNSHTHFDYLLAKKALHSFTQMAAVVLAPRLRVNAIALGPMLPPPGQGAGYLKRVAQTVPLKVEGHPAQVVAAVIYLEANTYITGQTIFLDGGMHL